MAVRTINLNRKDNCNMKKENSKRTGTIILFLVLALLLIFIIFIKNTGKANEGEDYQQQLELYLEAAKESPQKSSEYAYFPNDDLRLAHEQSNMRLIATKSNLRRKSTINSMSIMSLLRRILHQKNIPVSITL